MLAANRKAEEARHGGDLLRCRVCAEPGAEAVHSHFRLWMSVCYAYLSVVSCSTECLAVTNDQSCNSYATHPDSATFISQRDFFRSPVVQNLNVVVHEYVIERVPGMQVQLMGHFVVGHNDLYPFETGCELIHVVTHFTRRAEGQGSVHERGNIWL